jgi:hypothetical protein
VPDGGVVASDRRFVRIAAFGDSLMWGQGLNRNDRFTVLIAKGIGQEVKRTSTIVHDLSRSGAKIRARGDDRPGFVDTYPRLFPGGRGKGPFLRGRDEKPATGLYGEEPATFPTVQGQLNLMPDAMGREVDVALLDGGINDIEIEDVVNPQVETGRWIEHYDGAVRIVAHDDVLDLIGRTRRKCPNALIMYFGFFPPLSYESDTGKIRDFMKHEYNDDVAWWFNEHVLHAVNVDHLILEGIVRGLWFQGRWQYWTRKAVDKANHDDAIRGPGIVFVPSGFEERNAVFAERPYLWDDPYDPTEDDAREMRVKNIPRVSQLDALRQIFTDVSLAADADVRGDYDARDTHRARAMQETERLLAADKWPRRLENGLQYLADGKFGTMATALRNEIGRIQHDLIASLSHPNTAGAAQYAWNALVRYNRFHDVKNAIRQQALHPKVPVVGGETLEQLLIRCRLRGDGALIADAGHLDVDSIAIRVVTGDASDKDLLPDVWLVVTTKHAKGKTSRHSYLLNFKYGSIPAPGAPIVVLVWKFYPQFEPGTTALFTVDTAGKLRLDEIVGCSLVLGPDPVAGKGVRGYGTVWRPSEVRLEINGNQVVDLRIHGKEVRPNGRLDLHWPAPEPAFVAPKLAPVELAKAKPLAIAPQKIGTARVQAVSLGSSPRGG